MVDQQEMGLCEMKVENKYPGVPDSELEWMEKPPWILCEEFRGETPDYQPYLKKDSKWYSICSCGGTKIISYGAWSSKSTTTHCQFCLSRKKILAYRKHNKIRSEFESRMSKRKEVRIKNHELQRIKDYCESRREDTSE